MEDSHPTKIITVPKLVKDDIEFIVNTSLELDWCLEFVKNRFRRFKYKNGWFDSQKNTLVIHEEQLSIFIDRIEYLRCKLNSPKLKKFFDAVCSNIFIDIDGTQNEFFTLPSDHKHMFRSLMYSCYCNINDFHISKTKTMNEDLFHIHKIIWSARALSYCLRFEVAGEEKK